MAAPTVQEPQAVRIVWSASLVQGLGAGFALIVRPDRITGAKKFTQEHYVADLAATPDPAARAKAIEVVADLEKGRRFEFTSSEILGIDMSPPGRFGPGRIVLRTAKGEETVKIAGSFGTGSGDLFALLHRWLEAWAPGKVRKGA